MWIDFNTYWKPPIVRQYQEHVWKMLSGIYELQWQLLDIYDIYELLW